MGRERLGIGVVSHASVFHKTLLCLPTRLELAVQVLELQAHIANTHPLVESLNDIGTLQH